MKKTLNLLIAFFLLFCFSGNIYAQELTKEEKRARRKETRKLLKSSVKSFDSGDFDTSLGLLDSLLVLNPSNPDAFYYKGRILSIKGDSAQAITVLQKGTEAAPLSTRVKLLLSRLQISSGDLDSAASNLDYILGIKPNQNEALYLRGLIHLEKNESADAVKLFQKALENTIAKGIK